MIIGILTTLMLIFGGDMFTFENVKDAAEEVIKDKHRARQVVSITKQADEELELFTENLEKLSKQFVEMNKGYNLTREGLDSFSLQTKGNRMRFLNKYVELRFQMKDLMTAEEWQAMQSGEKK